MYFKENDAEIMELLMYCIGYIQSMVNDLDNEFSDLFHQFSVLLEM